MSTDCRLDRTKTHGCSHPQSSMTFVPLPPADAPDERGVARPLVSKTGEPRAI
jgi:hypothetical protein